MGFKIKNSLTGEFEKLPILTLKGEKGETGGVEEYNKVDYMGNKYETLKQANDANVEYAVKTAIGEFNYLDYDGQHITATDTIEGRSKSAILKGQTLINLSPFTKNNGVYELNASTHTTSHVLPVRLQQNKRYIFIFKLTNSQSSENSNFIMCRGLLTDGTFKEFGRKIQTFSNGKHWFMLSSSDGDIDSIFVGANFDVTLSDTLIIEYQDGMENWDIPYFEGMQSVKMPVLTTTGKNLFDVKDFAKKCGGTVNGNEYDSTTSKTDAVYDIFIPKGYTISYTVTQIATNGTPSASALAFIREDGTIFHRALNSLTRYVITASENYVGIKIVNYCSGWKFSEFQIEQGTQATTYEPYKSNILTVNGDVELRGIGDVKDELNVATGELTERIGEIKTNNIINEITIMKRFTDKLIIRLPLTLKTTTYSSNLSCPYLLCDKLKTLSFKHAYADNTEIGVYVHDTNPDYIYMCILNSNLVSNDLDGIKEYLKANPSTIQYKLLESTVKTVDLSDNHVYSYDNITHYDCSSAEGSLVPTLSVKVPTDVQATIAQQRETIQTLNSENERLNQIQEELKASMLDSQVQLMNLSWNTDFEVFALRESIAPKDFLLASRTGSNIDKFSQAKFIIENDCPDLEKLNSQIEYYFSKDVFSQEQFEELTDLISIVKGGNGCEY